MLFGTLRCGTQARSRRKRSEELPLSAKAMAESPTLPRQRRHPFMNFAAAIARLICLMHAGVRAANRDVEENTVKPIRPVSASAVSPRLPVLAPVVLSVVFLHQQGRQIPILDATVVRTNHLFCWGFIFNSLFPLKLHSACRSSSPAPLIKARLIFLNCDAWIHI